MDDDENGSKGYFPGIELHMLEPCWVENAFEVIWGLRSRRALWATASSLALSLAFISKWQKWHLVQKMISFTLLMQKGIFKIQCREAYLRKTPIVSMFPIKVSADNHPSQQLHFLLFYFTLTEWTAISTHVLTCWQIVFRTYFAYTSKLAVSMETLRPSDMSSRPAGCDSPEPLSSASP